MKLVLLFLVIIPLTIVSQNTDSTKARKISIGVTYSPDYCYRILKSDNASQWIANYRDSIEIPKFGFTTGLNISIKIRKRISLAAGVLFSDKGEMTKPQTLIWGTPRGQTDPTLPIKNKFIYHYRYLDIPIKINYHVLVKRLSVYVTAGISTNIFLSQEVASVQEYSDGHTSKKTSSSISGFDRINLAAIAGVGFGYDITKRIYCKIEPVYRRSITPIIYAPIKGYFYSLGLNTGLYVNL